MENISNVSSEEELLQLRNEGKITEDEYMELLETLRKTSKVDIEPAIRDATKDVRISGLAIASLVLSLALGPLGCAPGIVCGHLALRRIGRHPAVRGVGIAVAGLIVGYIILALSIIVVSIFMSFKPSYSIGATELMRFPVNSTREIITQSGVQIDKQITSDGNGSLRIEAMKPTTIRLFETGDIDIENARLIYQARVRAENIEGQVYLEMWCHFLGQGEFFSKDLLTPLSGTTEWTTEETPFFLKKGENPDNVKLNLVINGKGTAWIDDIRLLKGPLK